ncbi:unnamed protein product [Amoebophrya sp. A25]|nr:unnamed protein product [Amoebophrya sp. A25]|eukprot:GSA25T00015119001.1
MGDRQSLGLEVSLHNEVDSRPSGNGSESSDGGNSAEVPPTSSGRTNDGNMSDQHDAATPLASGDHTSQPSSVMPGAAPESTELKGNSDGAANSARPELPPASGQNLLSRQGTIAGSDEAHIAASAPQTSEPARAPSAVAPTVDNEALGLGLTGSGQERATGAVSGSPLTSEETLQSSKGGAGAPTACVGLSCMVSALGVPN